METQEQHPAIRLRALSHKYGRDWAIRDIEFDISGIGIVGLLGANGAGKSTIMNILCGVLYPSAGDVEIMGYSIRREPICAKRLMGFLPQQPPLYPEFTVSEYLEYAAKLRQISPAQIPKAVDEVVTKCGLVEHERRLIGALSGGYRQRVGIAQAIIHKPAIVIFDEPTNGLDPNQILSVRELIREIGSERVVLLSTHILSEVQALCQDIKMIHKGRLVFEGSMAEFENSVSTNQIFVNFTKPVSVDEVNNIDGLRVIELTEVGGMTLAIDPTIDSEAIVAMAQDRGWRLREIYRVKPTLESAFHHLSAR